MRLTVRRISGREKGRPGWNALRRHLIGISRYVNSVPRVIKMGEACFLTKTSLFLFPSGGDKRDRTADLLNAIQALSRMNGMQNSTAF